MAFFLLKFSTSAFHSCRVIPLKVVLATKDFFFSWPKFNGREASGKHRDARENSLPLAIYYIERTGLLLAANVCVGFLLLPWFTLQETRMPFGTMAFERCLPLYWISLISMVIFFMKYYKQLFNLYNARHSDHSSLIKKESNLIRKSVSFVSYTKQRRNVVLFERLRLNDY